LSEGDVWLPKLFRQTVPQHWPGSGKTAVTEPDPCNVFILQTLTCQDGSNKLIF